MDLSNFTGPTKSTFGLANYFSPTQPKHSNGDREVSWGPRKIHDWEMIYIAQGTASALPTNQAALTLLAGEVLFIPPHQEHIFRVSTERESTISCIHFNLHAKPASNASPTIGSEDASFKPTFFRIRANRDPNILSLFRKAGREWENDEIDRNAIATCLLHEILLRLNRIQKSSARQNLPRPLTQCIAWLNENFKKPITREDMAQVAKVTPQYLSALFRKHLNTSPIEFLNKRRISEAKRLLLEERCLIKAAAQQVGFDDPYYFSRKFKQLEGIAPSDFREML